MAIAAVLGGKILDAVPTERFICAGQSIAVFLKMRFQGEKRVLRPVLGGFSGLSDCLSVT